MQRLRTFLSLVLLLAWGSSLIHAYVVPAATPQWAQALGFRRVFLLNGHYEPTIFTLLFGLCFVSLAAVGMIALSTGRLRAMSR